MRLVGCGDSWCYGDELHDPVISPNFVFGKDSLNLIPGNIKYRIENRYLTLFGNMVGADEIVCLAFRSSSNDAIVRTLIDWLVNEGYATGRDTSDLFISIGWTSPERTEFFYKERWGQDNWFPFGYWSNAHPERDPKLGEFEKLYFELFWHAGEYMNRWIRQLWQTEMLLKSLNIKYVMHQAFYHHHHQMIRSWDDQKYLDNTKDVIIPSDKTIWSLLDPVRFMHKDNDKIGTFHHYIIDQVNGDAKSVFAEWHPNTLGHRIWADHMYEYCTTNKLL
jgi:hypothetical protein